MGDGLVAQAMVLLHSRRPDKYEDYTRPEPCFPHDIETRNCKDPSMDAWSTRARETEVRQDD